MHEHFQIKWNNSKPTHSKITAKTIIIKLIKANKIVIK